MKRSHGAHMIEYGRAQSEPATGRCRASAAFDDPMEAKSLRGEGDA